MSDEDQTMYHSRGVGMFLLYLVKHSHPDISNIGRKLSKSMSGATNAAFKEMKPVIKFVIHKKRFGLKFKMKLIGEDLECISLYESHFVNLRWPMDRPMN
jgi:hypothetical protein